MTGEVTPASPALFPCSFGAEPASPLQQSLLATLILWIDRYGPGGGESSSVSVGALQTVLWTAGLGVAALDQTGLYWEPSERSRLVIAPARHIL